jgi:pimeloyl-ACP methyl ester carboxylesterase
MALRLQKLFSALAVIATTLGCAPPKPRLPAKDTQALRQTVRTSAPENIEISYLQSGSGTRVIFMHGTPGSATGWSDYVLEPVAGTQSVALDRPGFGSSGPQRAVISLAGQASAVVALLPSDGTGAVLVGHSLGGAVAAWVAAEHPQRVTGLVLLASSLDPAQEAIHPMQHVANTWPISAVLPRALRNANDELMAFKPELEALAPRLAAITAPTIIVHGTQDDLVPFANVAYMQAKLSQVRCIKTMVLQDQNHFLPWNSEPAVRQAVQWALQPSC